MIFTLTMYAVHHTFNHTTMKNSFLITNTLFAVSLMFLACGPKQQQQESTVDQSQEHGHVHTYACPMHPEIEGHEGERCSKCGMPLEHTADAPVQATYTMKFTSSPEQIEAGKQVSLALTPINEGHPEAPVPLDVEHEKKIHLIMVSEDLSWFDHVHPEYQSDGRYTLSTTFPHGGKYRLYADYKPSGSTHQLTQIPVEVSGQPGAAQTMTKARTTATSSPFNITLQPENGKFLSHEAIHFDGIVFKNGKPYDVNQFPSYLGAKGHMVGIHTQSKVYVHLHPEVENGKLHFHTTFPEAGMYRIWLQFMDGEKLHTVDFNLMVEQGKTPATGGGTSDHGHEEHKYQHDVPEH